MDPCGYSYENFGLSEGFTTNHIEYFGLSEGSVAIPMITTDSPRDPWLFQWLLQTSGDSLGESEVLFRGQPKMYFQ